MTNALLVIDAQESFRLRPSWEAVSDPDIVGRINRLVVDARSRRDPVFWILQTEPGTGSVFDPARGHVRLLDGLEPRDGEPVLSKTSHNAFTTTNLQQQLTERGVRRLTVCGIRTEQCCETTARLASDLGFDVTFVIDATATTPTPHPDAPVERSAVDLVADPRTLTVDEITRRTEYALAGRFAAVRTVDEVVGAGAAHSLP